MRAVRLLRVFKLARSWTSFRDLLSKMIVTIKDIRNFAVLMFLFMFIYTLLGMEMYAYKIRFKDEDFSAADPEGEVFPRANFNNFLYGIITIFIVFIGEDWNSSMYDVYRATGPGAYLFFISLFVIGNLILLNLFLAILLKNFEEPPGGGEDDEEEAEAKPKKSALQTIKGVLCGCCKRKEDEGDTSATDEGPAGAGADKPNS